MTHLFVRNVRVANRGLVDVLVHDDRIESIGPSLQAPADGTVEIDGCGEMLLPGLVDAHAHLDKTTWGLPYRPHTAGPSLDDLTENERRFRGELGADVGQRAAALLEQCVAAGTTHMRTHVDVDTEAGLSSIEGVLSVAEQFAGQISVEVVAFPQSGLVRRPGTAELLDKAMDAGATVVGGIDPAGFDRDPIAHLDVVFGIADRRGCAVDIHLHDAGELGAWEIDLIAERTRALGLAGRVVISHAFALGTVSDRRQAELADLLQACGIAIATTAPGKHPMIPVALLRQHGVSVCCGNDGVRDLWSPYGNGDMLERAMLLAYRCGFRRDEDVEMALEAATMGGATALGLPNYGLEPGCQADFIIAAGTTPVDAMMRHQPRRAVVKSGRVVSGTVTTSAESRV